MSQLSKVDKEINIIETAQLQEVNKCVIGLPDVGLVGLITVNHLIMSLEMSEVGHVESPLFPPIIVVHKGEPKAPIRLFAKGDMVVVTSEVPVSASILNLLAHEIMNWALDKDIGLIISTSGIAVQNRLEIETPEVYGVASTNKARSILKDANISLLEEGFMVGPHAAILKESIQRSKDSVILLAQSHYQYPDPGASAVMIGCLNKLLSINVNVKQLLEQAEEIRLKTRETMQRTFKNMQKMQKLQEQELPPMYV
jgi:uncharacterized protein